MNIQTVRSIARYVHGAGHFTQGLLVHGGRVLESTGNYGESHLVYRTRRYLVETARHQLDGAFFAEGICTAPGGVIVLSFRENKALLWNVEKGRPEQVYPYDREGWGICAISGHYFTSDGSSTLVRRRHDLSPIAAVEVMLGGQPLAGLNSLTTHAGNVLANVYGEDYLVEVDADTGEVLTLIDATTLRRWEPDEAGVLNGACPYNARSLLLTGKYWKWMHEVTLEPVEWITTRLDEVLAAFPRLYRPEENRLLTRATYAREHPRS